MAASSDTNGLLASSSAEPAPGHLVDGVPSGPLDDIAPQPTNPADFNDVAGNPSQGSGVIDRITDADIPTPSIGTESAWGAAQAAAASLAGEASSVAKETIEAFFTSHQADQSATIASATSAPDISSSGVIEAFKNTVSAVPTAITDSIKKHSNLSIPQGKPASRVWGHVTSSVDWCETNYQWTSYIAEFWNTVSSFFMVTAGYLGRQHMTKKDAGIWDPVLEMPSACGLDRIWWTWVMLEVVGWGSVAFHANLKWWSQAFDEVPMVWTSCMMLTTLMTSRLQPLPLPQPPPAPSISFKPVPKETTMDKLHRVALNIFLPRQTLLSTQPAITSVLSPFLAQYALMCTALITIFRGPVQFYLFHILFGIIQWTCFILLCLIVVDAEFGNPQSGPPRRGMGKDTFGKLMRAHKYTVRKLFLAGCGSYGVAMLVWFTDFKACDTIQKRWWINPQGHAIWHLLVSIGFYYLHTLAVYDRLLAAYRTNDNQTQEGLLTLFSDLQKNSPNYIANPITSPLAGNFPSWPPPLPISSASSKNPLTTTESSSHSENGEENKEVSTEPSGNGLTVTADGQNGLRPPSPAPPAAPIKVKKASRGDAPEVVWVNDWIPVVRIRREEKKRR